jgi:restriction endonuclease S subunit
MNTAIKVKLSRVADIIPGAAKSAFKVVDNEQVSKGLLMKGTNLGKKGLINLADAESIEYQKSSRVTRCVLMEGDVVVMSRGSFIRPGLVTADVASKNVIASPNFLIIRPKDILGEVIAAWLSTTSGAVKLGALSVGAAIQHIPASSLRELEIHVPSIEDQAKIKEIYLASQEYYVSTIALAEQQWLAASARINQLANGEG